MEGDDVEIPDGCDTVIAAFADPYGRLLGKRFDVDFYRSAVAAEGTHVCDYLVGVDIEMEPQSGYGIVGWEHGYGDLHLVPDRATMRPARWSDRTAIVLCDVEDAGGSPLAVAPRTILRRQVDRLAGLGLHAEVASELEFFELDDDRRPAGHDGTIQDYHLLATERAEPMLGDLRRTLIASGIPVESSKGEFGVGQHEVNLVHTDPVEMSDRHVLFKHAAKLVAARHDRSITFMAKPFTERAGSSGHLHLSLWEGGTALGDDPRFESFVAGWIEHVHDLMVCWAPTVNSYKRYVDGSWAPTRIAWAHDNRTAAFRTIGAGPQRRVEFRVPGADVNPYLAFAAALAAGIDGIERGLALPAELRGDAYAAAQLPRVARTLRTAVERFEASPVARHAFGDVVVDHYAHFHRLEVDAFDDAVTDWERQRYAVQI